MQSLPTSFPKSYRTIKQLQQDCKLFGLSTVGKRDDLIRRLSEFCDGSDFNALCEAYQESYADAQPTNIPVKKTTTKSTTTRIIKKIPIKRLQTSTTTQSSARRLSTSQSSTSQSSARQSSTSQSSARQSSTSTQHPHAMRTQTISTKKQLTKPPSSRDSEPSEHEQLIDFSCKICYDKQRNIIFQPCGHLVACNACSTKCTKCPICRANIREKQSIYL